MYILQSRVSGLTVKVLRCKLFILIVMLQGKRILTVLCIY